MNNLHTQLQERFPAAVLEIHAQQGDETVLIKRENLLEIAAVLKNDPSFSLNVLMDLTAVDGLARQGRRGRKRRACSHVDQPLAVGELV